LKISDFRDGSVSIEEIVRLTYNLASDLKVCPRDCWFPWTPIPILNPSPRFSWDCFFHQFPTPIQNYWSSSNPNLESAAGNSWIWFGWTLKQSTTDHVRYVLISGDKKILSEFGKSDEIENVAFAVSHLTFTLLPPSLPNEMRVVFLNNGDYLFQVPMTLISVWKL
jgi:hypothetical protein